jgi:Cytochrome P450
LKFGTTKKTNNVEDFFLDFTMKDAFSQQTTDSSFFRQGRSQSSYLITSSQLLSLSFPRPETKHHSRFLQARKKEPILFETSSCAMVMMSVLKFANGGGGALRRCLRAPHHTAAIATRYNSSVSSLSGEKSQSSSYVPLKHVPALPLVGSLISQHSGITFDYTDPSGMWLQCREKGYGDFYTIGFPNLGAGLYGTLHILNDPMEMQKVLRAEGKFPTSGVMDLWSFRQFQDDYGVMGRAGEILGYGLDWKLVRNFMQTDLLAPQSANRYLPGILEATRFISKGMPHHAHELNMFLQQASFDLFCSVLYGRSPRITDPDTVSDPEEVDFCNRIATVISDGSNLHRSIYESILHKLGIKSKSYTKVYKDWQQAIEFGLKKVTSLGAKKEAGMLTEAEEASYWNHAMERWKLGETDLTREEVEFICVTMFTVSVDTTSAKASCLFLHVGLNEEAQDKLYQEIHDNVQETNGVITPGMFAGSKSPYLGAFVRECMRLTLPINLNPIRKIAENMEIHGHVIKAGSKIAFDQIGKSLDPEFVDDPYAFRPERFLPDAVEKRKGTKSEFLDHPFYGSAFGQGARRCPGSRVARNEVMTLLAQSVLDWKMSIPGYHDFRDVPIQLETFFTPQLPKFDFKSRSSA